MILYGKRYNCMAVEMKKPWIWFIGRRVAFIHEWSWVLFLESLSSFLTSSLKVYYYYCGRHIHCAQFSSILQHESFKWIMSDETLG